VCLVSYGPPHPARQVRTGDSGLGVHCRLPGTDPNPAPLASILKPHCAFLADLHDQLGSLTHMGAGGGQDRLGGVSYA
jgi:hypothetical protein